MNRFFSLCFPILIVGATVHRVELEVSHRARISRWKLEIANEGIKISRLNPPGPTTIHTPGKLVILMDPPRIAIESSRPVPPPPFFHFLRKTIMQPEPQESDEGTKRRGLGKWEVERDESGKPKKVIFSIGPRRVLEINVISLEKEEIPDWKISRWWEGYTFLQIRELRDQPMRDFLEKNHLPEQIFWLKPQHLQIFYADEKQWALRVFYAGLGKRWMGVEISSHLPPLPLPPKFPHKPLVREKNSIRIAVWGNTGRGIMERKLESILQQIDFSPTLILP